MPKKKVSAKEVPVATTQSVRLYIVPGDVKALKTILEEIHEENTDAKDWLFLQHLKSWDIDTNNFVTFELAVGKRHPNIAREMKMFLAGFFNDHAIGYAVEYSGQPKEEVPAVFSTFEPLNSTVE